jgi:hypothetical protein
MAKEATMAQARFRPGVDDDIKQKYNELPENERSDNVRDALRLWFGITKKLVFRPTEIPVQKPTNTHKPLILKGGPVHDQGRHT